MQYVHSYLRVKGSSPLLGSFFISNVMYFIFLSLLYVFHWNWVLLVLIKTILTFYHLQLRHLVWAPFDQMPASDWLYKHPRIMCQENKSSTLFTHVTCESKIGLNVKLGTCDHIHPQETGRQSGVRSRLPTHLLQELCAGTVQLTSHD